MKLDVIDREKIEKLHIAWLNVNATQDPKVVTT